MTGLRIAVIGASGAIGAAFVRQLASRGDVTCVHALSRSAMPFDSDKVISGRLDLLDEASIAEAASQMNEPLDWVIVATGLLHDETVMPEKALRDLSAEVMARVFAVNSIGPALVMKHFLPLLPREGRSVFAAISARVGSISDNHLGGWYGYRAAKAALNMLIRTAAIETARRKPQAVVVGLHPGTVDSKLSKPFQGHVKPQGLFSPDEAAARLIAVLEGLLPEQSGRCFAYDGQEILP